MTYRAPINDMLLALNHGAGLQAAVKAGHYGDFDADITAAVLEEAGRFASDVLAPLNRIGDEHGIKLEAAQATTAPGSPDSHQPQAAAGVSAGAGRDRGAGRAGQRRAEEYLSGETGVGRMARHQPAPRAAGRLRRRRAA